MTHTPPHTRQTRLCIPVCVNRIDRLDKAIKRAAEVADIIELRLDCLDPDELRRITHASDTTLNRLLHAHTQDFILTLRPPEEGGRGDVNLTDRFAFWNYGAEALLRKNGAANVSCDIELALLEHPSFVRALEDNSYDWQRVICSFHDFDSVPADLESIYERAAQTPAHTIKIAVTARDAVDCIPVFKLCARARRDARPLIAIAMNTPGLLTRVLSRPHGSAFTFAALDENSATAPGQPTATTLRDLYRIQNITERTMLTGLIGAPVSHSLSPQMHNRAFNHAGIDAVYLPLEVHDLAAFLRRMVRRETREINFNWRGFSVTAPHKQTILAHLDTLDPAARNIGAVNTVVALDGSLYGYNTDHAALLTPLENRINLHGARVAVIGAGGAARATLWSLRERGAHTTVFARNHERAAQTSHDFDAAHAPLDGARFDGLDLVINATPLGTWKHDGTHEHETPARADQLRGARLVYDLVYNPRHTAFMRAGEAAGCEAIGGLEMLIGQAAAQWKLWTGEDAPVEVMRSATENKLS